MSTLRSRQVSGRRPRCHRAMGVREKGKCPRGMHKPVGPVGLHGLAPRLYVDQVVNVEVVELPYIRLRYPEA